MDTAFDEAVWQCVNYPSPVAPVNCCDRTKWVSQCYHERGSANNFVRCGIPYTGPGSCANQCIPDEDTDTCYDCCVDLKQDEWNCPEPEASKAEVFSCEEYTCDSNHRYAYTKHVDTLVTCPENDGKHWFSKDVGTLEEGSPFEYCLSLGYTGLNLYAYEAWPGGPADPEDKGANKKDWMCNVKSSRDTSFDYVTPGAEDAKERLTFKCEKRSEGSDKDVECCSGQLWNAHCF